MDTKIPNNFYRVSMKALIFDETHTKFAVIREDNDLWELPGGGLDFGETTQDCLRREIKEETGLVLTTMSKEPVHYLIGKNMDDHWSVALVFEATVADFNYTVSKECQELKFVSPEEALSTPNMWRTVTELATFLKND